MPMTTSSARPRHPDPAAIASRSDAAGNARSVDPAQARGPDRQHTVAQSGTDAATRLRHLFIYATLAFAWAAPAHAWQADERAYVPPAGQDRGIALNRADSEFLGYALDHSRAMTQALEIAIDRTPSPEIAEMAVQMHDAHLALSAGLMELAAGSDASHTTMFEHLQVRALREVPPTQFDRAFFKVMREAHDEALLRYRIAVRDPRLSERVRMLAEQALPTIEMHDGLTEHAAVAAGR